jgi:ornithine cyclodeaminase
VSVLVLSGADVRRLLTPDACARAMRDTFVALARDEVHQPLRMVVNPPGAKGVMAAMPSYRAGADGAYALKVVCVFHDNPAHGKDAHQGAVMLCSNETGELLALANASALTEIRTAAVSAVATEALARPDSTELAVIGAGVQARAHIRALAGVRDFKRIRVAARDLARTAEFVRTVAPSVDVPVEAVASAREAVEGADVVVTATNSAQPVLRAQWLAPGTHVNAVGSSIPAARELDSATLAAGTLFVDRRESTVNESGDYLMALAEGAIGPDAIRAELGAVLTGADPGRTDAREITVFKSLGLAAQDLAAVAYVYRQARESGAGTWVEY